MNRTGKLVRPRIDSDLIVGVMIKHPEETRRMRDGEVVAWALKQFLGIGGV